MRAVVDILLKPRYKMIVKIHKTPDGRKIVAICDNRLIGKKFEEKNLQLDLSSSFYKGEEKSKEEIIKLLKDSYIVNIVGKECMGLAIKLGIIGKKNVIKIKNVPHAQAILE